MLRASGLTLTVDGVTHLDSVDLELRPGKIHTVIGRTLAGKTTLLRALAGLTTVDSGTLELDGMDLASKPPWARDTAMVYQQFINYPHLSVLDNVTFPLRRAGVSRDEATARAMEVIEMVGLAAFRNRRPAELSGGQQQRVAIARALARRTRILLLDEPLVNLDYKLREQLREEFRALFAENSEAIVVYTTTEPAEALMLGDEVIVLHEGRVLQVGPPSEVYERPAGFGVAAIVNDPPMNLIDGHIDGQVLALGGLARLPRPAHFAGVPDGSYRFGLRADDLTMATTGVGADVKFVEISGSETFVHLDHGGTELVLRAEGVHEFALGSTLQFRPHADQLFMFDGDGRLRVAPAPLERD